MIADAPEDAPVAVLGLGQVGYREAMNYALDDLIFEAVNTALSDAQISLHEIDSVIIACSDMMDGRAISSMVTTPAAGGHMKDEVNTASASDHAAIVAYMRIRGGIDNTSLVVSWSKCSETPVTQVENLSADPFFERDLGTTQISAAAMQAAKYRDDCGLSEDTVAEVVVQSRKNGLRNPHVHWNSAPSAAEVLGSKYLCWPIKELEMPPFSDGACAMVLASAETANKTGTSKAWIKGVGWASDTYWQGDRDMTALQSTRLAAQRAYEMAGLRDPAAEVDVVELHDISAHHWFMACEALGFAAPRQAATLLESAQSDGPSINPSGGTLSANPGFASGLVRLAEAALQVEGRAGGRQVAGAKVAVAHALSGHGGQNASVFVFTSEV